jgi:hypothetical protein
MLVEDLMEVIEDARSESNLETYWGWVMHMSIHALRECDKVKATFLTTVSDHVWLGAGYMHNAEPCFALTNERKYMCLRTYHKHGQMRLSKTANGLTEMSHCDEWDLSYTPLPHSLVALLIEVPYVEDNGFDVEEYGLKFNVNTCLSRAPRKSNFDNEAYEAYIEDRPTGRPGWSSPLEYWYFLQDWEDLMRSGTVLEKQAMRRPVYPVARKK